MLFLCILGYEEESTNVLSRAADFHRAAAFQGLLSITENTSLGRVIPQPPKKGQVRDDDNRTCHTFY